MPKLMIATVFMMTIKYLEFTRVYKREIRTHQRFMLA